MQTQQRRQQKTDAHAAYMNRERESEKPQRERERVIDIDIDTDTGTAPARDAQNWASGEATTCKQTNTQTN